MPQHLLTSLNFGICITVGGNHSQHFSEFETNACLVFHNVVPSSRRHPQVHQWSAYHAVLTTPTVIYSVLANAIMHLGMVMTISDNSTLQDVVVFGEYKSNSLIYRGRATRLISQSLSTVDATSDPIFLAILDMVCCYASMGETSEVTPHIKGLNTLMNLRRGIQQLSPYLAYRVIRSDNVVAAMTGRSAVYRRV
jgi:hypothetical protein